MTLILIQFSDYINEDINFNIAKLYRINAKRFITCIDIFTHTSWQESINRNAYSPPLVLGN